MEFRNGKYREMIWMGNKQVKSPSFTRKSDAIAWKANMLNQRTKLQVLGEEYKVQTKITFLDYSNDWIENVIRISKSPSTYTDYERILRCHLFPIIGSIALKDIKVKEADKVVIALTKKGMSPKGTQDVLTLLKQVLNEAERREDITKNPLRHFKGPKVPERHFKYWSDSEINSFLLTCRDSEYYPFFVTAFYTGMRKGEIAALTWSSVDFQRNLITIKATLDKYGHRESTKSGRIRYVPMNGFLRNVLLELFKNRSEASQYVFLIKGHPVDTNHLYRVFQGFQNKAGIPNKIRVHDTRHTFASQFMMKGLGSLYELSQILGHTDTKMTQRYAHLSPNHLSRSTQNLVFGMEGELSKNFTPILPQRSLRIEEPITWEEGKEASNC